MQYVPGATLREHVGARGPLEPVLVAILGAALAEGLATIHREGLLHRDLKPHNIILADHGPVVIDFGLALLTKVKVAAAESASRVTEPGTVVGTLLCMPPEQVRAEPLTSAADVYALGGAGQAAGASDREGSRAGDGSEGRRGRRAGAGRSMSSASAVVAARAFGGCSVLPRSACAVGCAHRGRAGCGHGGGRGSGGAGTPGGCSRGAYRCGRAAGRRDDRGVGSGEAVGASVIHAPHCGYRDYSKWLPVGASRCHDHGGRVGALAAGPGRWQRTCGGDASRCRRVTGEVGADERRGSDHY